MTGLKVLQLSRLGLIFVSVSLHVSFSLSLDVIFSRQGMGLSLLGLKIWLLPRLLPVSPDWPAPAQEESPRFGIIKILTSD